MIVTDVIEPEEAYEYGVVDDDGANLHEYGESGSEEVGARTGVYAAETEEL